MCYDNQADANRYLAGSVVYWDGQPIYVGEVYTDYETGVLMVQAFKMPYDGQDQVKVPLHDPRFNPFKFKTGYVNTRDGEAVYLRRVPARIQLQGLCNNNTVVTSRDGGRGYQIRSLLRDPGLTDTLKGVYPTLEEVKDKLARDVRVTSMAFSRDLAVVRHPQFKNLFFLSYRNEDISFSQDCEFTLAEEFSYLTQICEPKGCLKKAVA